jgi:hypothetical protein
MSHEWLAEIVLSSEVARIISPLKCPNFHP